MRKPALVVLAAGMGSRYGGLKQIDGIGPHGEKILDYSLFDARRAGFEHVVFVIKEELLDPFREAIGDRAENSMRVSYVFQKQDAFLPSGVAVPSGRVKPWGTGHAVLCCKDIVDGPFVVINADDFYGRDAYESLFSFFSSEEHGPFDYAMSGYVLSNTLTDNGSVSRGICTQDKDGYLVSIEEKTGIIKKDGGIFCDDPEGAKRLPGDSVVSLNFWGFQKSFLGELEKGFEAFFKSPDLIPEKSEFYLPYAVNSLIIDGRARVKVLKNAGMWYGVTYKEDKASVRDSLAKLHDAGIYPDGLNM